MKELKVGMIGAGWVSRYHLRGWQPQSPQAKVVAIADPNAKALQSCAADFGIPSTYADAESLIDGASPDILDICAPREFHADLVRLAAARSIPAICQKPLAMNLGEAERLIADVDGRVPIMVHENWRFRKYNRRIAELLGSNAVGELRHVQLEFLSSGMIAGADGARPALVRQPFLRTLDRMLVAEILIHHLDTLRFLLGEFQVVSARIMRSNEEIAGEDGAAVALRRRATACPCTWSPTSRSTATRRVRPTGCGLSAATARSFWTARGCGPGVGWSSRSITIPTRPTRIHTTARSPTSSTAFIVGGRSRPRRMTISKRWRLLRRSMKLVVRYNMKGGTGEFP